MNVALMIGLTVMMKWKVSNDWISEEKMKIMANNYERDKKSIMRYQKENIVYVKVGMSSAEKENWQAIAESSGMPLATLIRKLMKEYVAGSNIL